MVRTDNVADGTSPTFILMEVNPWALTFIVCSKKSQHSGVKPMGVTMGHAQSTGEKPGFS